MISAPVAKHVEVGARPPGARRVLVAEDSAITHDLLKLLLNQRGHEVDVVTDGLSALEALRNNSYDVALLDYHLPHMDGLDVAAALKAEARGRRLPRLIAITADPEGLLSADEGCEQFDYILPKPLDINQVGKVVEEQAQIADRAAAQARASDTERRGLARVAAPLPPILEGLGLKFLEWPEDVAPERLSSRATQAISGDMRFDALIVRLPAPPQDLATIWQHKALFALPVIDLTGTLGVKADLDAAGLKPGEKDQVERVIRRFRERRAHLHRDLLLSDDVEDRLLGRIFVSGKPLTATLDPASRTCVSYNVTLTGDAARENAEDLCARGLLKREFVERFHVCSHCGSERLHVRKGCIKCHSANLAEEQYLRHFRCGFQGPKSEFRRGLKLVCPKCQHELGEAGIDHDLTGTTIICRSCGHADTRTVTGMVCLDCGGYDDWEKGRTRDAYSYQLSDQGLGFAEYGRSFLGLFQKPLRFEELPRELIVALNEAARKFTADRTPFTLVNIFYKNERAITSEHGGRQFAEARDQFIDNLRSALGHGRLVVKGPSSYDFALLPGVAPHQAQRDFPALRARAVAPLRLDIGATLKAFGPEDF